MKTALLLIGHGSRVPEANEALHAIAALVAEMTGLEIVEVCFREHPPPIQDGIDRCVARGAQRLLLYPYFLFAGSHVQADLPAEIAMAARRHPGLPILLSQPLGVHRKLAEVVCQRLEETVAEKGWSLRGEGS